MKKMIAMASIVCCLAATSLCACGVNYHETSTTTTTTTTTDANGKTTSHTETTHTNTYPDDSCFKTADDGKEHECDLTVVNEIGEDMTAFYICRSGETEWSNVLEEGQVIHDGETLKDALMLPYTSESMTFNMGYETEDGQTYEFHDIDISNLDKNGFAIEFRMNDGQRSWHIDASYVKF